MSDTKEANSKSSDIEKYVTEKKGDENSNSGGVGGLTTTTMSAVQTVQTNALVIAETTNNVPPPAALPTPAPNSKPRERDAAPIETYVYRDFASAEPSTINTGTSHERMPPQSLQSQKLPSKLAAMLSDPDLASVLTWMPHGRSWKILNRELFSSFALPRYFGHSNHASFVRIVNAWGFRRVTKGTDRDSYYHELFLRCKPRLHERMKRLPTCHRKTPVDKDDKCPDFYELAKTSPLPELSWSFSGGAGPGGGSAVAPTSAMNQVTAAAAAAGYLGNSMAATATTHSLGLGGGLGSHGLGNGGGLGNHGLGNHNTNALFGNLHGSGPSPPTSAMESYLSNANNQGNDIPSLLKLLRQQGTLQQHQQVQQGSNNANNVMNQNLMHQLLRMQHTHPSQQTRNMNTSPSQSSSLLGGGNANSTLGKLASVAGSFAQPPITTSSSDAVFNSLTSSSMNGILPNQPQRRLSNDKISVNDVIQLRSIERTNELLAQKLASMQQDTQIMKQNAGDGSPTNAADQLSSANKHSPLHNHATGAPSNRSSSATPSKEEMLLQMIRRENQMNGGLLNHQAAHNQMNGGMLNHQAAHHQMNGGLLNHQTAGAPAKVSRHAAMEEGGGAMNQGLNLLLNSLTGMQQHQRANAL
mmetsp:Transcript_26957/g.48645  ORF Transcript_26957/g.48645 Transcript_26957/m.48645 type:complete len:640 (-) Transcript_26957:117-2036(-)|eukprot:CAMPEP_0201911048 /NCGR_PEP_ID=MMETSP0903-20130614/2161_1 /ASSEMBLY_ACC=CAM_ASM_000552 /TAXON_ID=420261 /ORGANISM="Thalassiosira antarctica, Strain CCMP982" /LENGTH=639 /DNA_ID=CAMNT_0048445733 /DNA_START=133 /DNA_END=2052 /DNA_ORIENTATION=+